MSKTDIVILSAARTPIGNLKGCFKGLSASELGSYAIQGALKRFALTPDTIQEVLMGCVLMAGQGQAPARQAAIKAGLSNHIPCTTINKMCGSGMKAIMFAHDEIAAGSYHTILAGGMESMTNTPFLMPKIHTEQPIIAEHLIDHMKLDGLEDAYEKGKLMGYFAELCVEKYQFTRQELDDYAIRSLTLARKANEEGVFTAEIEPVLITENNERKIINLDETPFRAKIEKIPELKPAFIPTGKITAANSSSISDGAAAIILSTQQQAMQNNLKPLARIVAHYTYAHDPAWFTTAPIFAIQGVLKKAHWTIDEVDLFEINEAFAAVTLAAIHDLNLPLEKVNIHGGACALGHPLGASGARILVTLLYALQKYHLKKGIATLCIGGGEATAVAIEML